MITLDSPQLINISSEDLGELLVQAKKAYYTSGKPIMDDHTYDTLEEILRQKSPHHRIFQKAGHDNFDSGFSKKPHQMVMGSQNKVVSYEEMSHYFELKKVNLASGFIVEPKCDGISLEIIYQDGQLVEAITRGDGEVGDVITQNVVHMKNFVNNPSHFSGSVRCEIVVTKDDFKKLNEISTEKYSNSRNAASGLSQRLDSKLVNYCSLFAVDCNFSTTTTEQSKMDLLKKLGFTTVESYHCHNYQEIENIYQQFLENKRFNYPFEIDGLVIKINDLAIQTELGSQNNRPKGQVAYKFPSQSNQTIIKSIEWQVGPMGLITPVAEVEPVELAGATVTYASLANHKLVREKNINIGDVIEISRRGDVIPHIEKVITKVNYNHAPIPQYCPTCKTTLLIEDRFLRCPNTSCLSQVLGSLRLFCNTLDIKGLSDKTILKLYEANLVKLPGDFLKLAVNDIKDLDNLGEKSAKNIINQIQSKKVLSLVEILDSAAIPNFSKKRILQVIRVGFDTPAKILNLSTTDLESLPGFQQTLARKIIEGLKSRSLWLSSIFKNVTLKKTLTPSQNSKIYGLNFCITGELSVPRKDIEDKIISLGGKVQSGVSKTTNYLITNDQTQTSSKLTSARKLGVSIITEAELSSLM